MDVAFVSNVVYPFVTGGAETRVYEIGTRLADQGHTVTTYGRHFWDGPKRLTYDGMHLHAVAPPRELYTESGRRSIVEALDFSAQVLPPLRRNIASHDVVIVSVFPYFPVLTSKLATVGASTPLVTTWHEVWMEYWDSYLGRLAPFGRSVEWLTARTPQSPVAVSEVTAGRLATLGVNRDSIAVVPNGINFERIRRIPPADESFDVLFSGRLIADKHVDLLIRAVDRIAADHRITLGIVGDGPERTALEALASRSDAADQITFLGFLEAHDDLIALMKAATMFASPSTREGFGITTVEAMAAGCTVIGADHPTSAAREIIGDGGFLVDPTVEALAATIERVLEGERARADPSTIAQRYDWDVITEEAAAVYRAAME